MEIKRHNFPSGIHFIIAVIDTLPFCHCLRSLPIHTTYPSKATFIITENNLNFQLF